MQFARKPRRQPFINIISLIDILVVLLIFYIATTVFKRFEPKINVTVPHSTTAKVTQDTIPDTVYVTSGSKVFFNDTPVDIEKLGDLLKSKKGANNDFKLAMKSDENAPWKVIVKVMDAANQAGIANISTYTATKPAAGANP
jgi:biopolymer transport protein ExbD